MNNNQAIQSNAILALADCGLRLSELEQLSFSDLRIGVFRIRITIWSKLNTKQVWLVTNENDYATIVAYIDTIHPRQRSGRLFSTELVRRAEVRDAVRVHRQGLGVAATAEH